MPALDQCRCHRWCGTVVILAALAASMIGWVIYLVGSIMAGSIILSFVDEGFGSGDSSTPIPDLATGEIDLAIIYIIPHFVVALVYLVAVTSALVDVVLRRRLDRGWSICCANAWGILFIALSMFLLAVLTITLVFSEGIAEDNDLYDFAEGITGLKFSHIITPTIIELSGISFCALSFLVHMCYWPNTLRRHSGGFENIDLSVLTDVE